MGSKLILLLWLIVGSLLTFFCLNKEKRELLLEYKNIYLNQAKVSDVANVNNIEKQDTIKQENKQEKPKENRAVFTVIEKDEPAVAEEVMDKNSTTQNISNATAVKTMEDKIALLLHEHPIYFKTNSSTIRKDSQEGLTQISTALKELPKTTIVTVEGHTDATGKATLNKKLSQQRADAVKFYLKKSGLNHLIIKATGYGAERPLVSDPNDKKNRRVEIRLERGE
jgi:outer membrane protein OmpA-like peptidoglycan-associated protein